MKWRSEVARTADPTDVILKIVRLAYKVQSARMVDHEHHTGIIKHFYQYKVLAFCDTLLLKIVMDSIDMILDTI